MLHAVIMAGGGGTRFWPRSRARHPKQFLTLTGERSLIQQTCDRIEVMVPPERTWVITTSSLTEQCREQLPQIPAEQIIGEPMGRDTAPCIGLGAALIHQQDAKAVMIAMPADHVIEPVPRFHLAVDVGVKQVEEHPEALLTFGIPPTFPATGYGYIHRESELATMQGVTINRVAGFEEKPEFDIAEKYVASGEYYWNSGIFIWKTKALLDELKQHKSEIHNAVTTIAKSWGKTNFADVFRRQYEGLTKISIDYAVMEKAKSVVMVQAPFQWDDVGSWLALERMNPQDADGNTVLSQHLGIETNGCIIAADKETMIATIGVNNLLIIQDGNAILVADKKEEGTVKKIVETLKDKKLESYL